MSCVRPGGCLLPSLDASPYTFPLFCDPLAAQRLTVRPPLLAFSPLLPAMAVPDFDPAPLHGQVFDFEVENQLDIQRRDDDMAEGRSTDLCRFFFSPQGCAKGSRCQYRHARNDRLIVCKHWLRGLCKKDEFCEYLHEFDLSKMPECYFFSKFGECSNTECMYRHIDPEKKRNECPYFARGFCKHGPKCRHRHVKKVACANYLAGFCKDGPECVFGHARFETPRADGDDDPGGIDRFGFGRPKGPAPKIIFRDNVATAAAAVRA